MSDSPRPISRVEFVALIAALGTIVAAAIDVMLPALPNMGDAFMVANPNDRSLVLTVFLIGLGLPQLVVGPLTDRFGRRTPLLIGLVIYSIAALAAPLAPSFGALLLLRFVQGMGAAAVSVASQATVRDLYSGRAMAEIMSMVWSVFMIVPILAPGVGQVILLTGPWQLIFAFMGGLGIIFGAWGYFRLAETLMPANRRGLSFRVIIEGFAIVLGNRSSLFYGLAGVFMFGGVLGLVNSAQQIYVGIYGLGAFFPIAFAVAPITFAVAFLLNSRLVNRFGMRRLAHGSMVAFVAITGTWLTFALAGFMPLWLFIGMLTLTVLSQGLAWGNVGALAMEPLGEVAGTASAVFGSFSTVGAALLAYGIAQTFNGTTVPVIGAFFLFGLLVVGCFLIAEGGKLFGGHPAPGAEAAAPTSPG
jgi:DHA1 family bicyclomycin/chloramphenicol resistance-like MFS transporter